MKTIFSLVLLALLLGPGPAAANPTVYHSSDGIDSGEPKQLRANWSETIDLYVCVRTADGTACSAGTEDRLRGIDVTVEVEGDGQFTGFAKNGDVVHYPEAASFPPSTSTFRLNVVQGTSPPSAGPQLLGTLNLDTGPDGSAVTAKGQVVTAAGALMDIPDRVIASGAGTPRCNVGTDSDGDGIADHCECGDFDGDGFVNTVDARLIQRCSVAEFPCADLCDVNDDGDCNTIDARLVQRLAVGELTKQDLHCAERP